MELLFIAIGGAIVGLAAHYALPWRGERGVLLVPAVGVIVASIVWLGLTVLGWPWDGGWIWAVTLVAATALSVMAALTIGRARAASDERRLVSLGG
ncbi:hypothetical protein CLV49_3554 [Labedella gwakjiensis]|uniref:Integral membrane protein n=1 Tax=Labedella gwakjiensis TaxID=390269 RepID=A0A2P8H107_9MICO|nr:hypothetical protein [Labedella gwakjiensis]PSL39899.1 hypothetical protein CLV49_3554 [Labedella gwakjiensis]RUQ85736.1 hypothetical protein ELQ93_01490 [Labedella gwakjiensis]